MVNNELTILALEKFNDILINELEKAITKENNYIERLKRKKQDVIETYGNIEGVNEAFACGEITFNKRDKLIDFFEQIDGVAPASIYSELIKIIKGHIELNTNELFLEKNRHVY